MMLARLRAVVSGLARRRTIEAEVNDELRFHLEQEINLHVARGLSTAEARRIALRDLGGLTQTREAVTAVRMTWVDNVWQDVKYGLRVLRRAPAFSSVAILTLGLGIGANTAIFSIVNAVLLRPLPYTDPGSLVLLEPTPMILSPAWATNAWRARAKTLRDLAGFNGPRAATLRIGGESETVEVVDVTPNLLSFLGVRPGLGRPFTEHDTSVAILSYDFWSQRFGADPAVLGKGLSVGDESLTIVGVVPATFRFPTGGAVPATSLPSETQPDVIRVARAGSPLNVLGRLASGATPGSAASELLGIYKQESAGQFRKQLLDRLQVNVVPLQERLVGDVGRRLWLVMGAVGFVLLIACANVANLMLARVSSRQRELAVRSALGAGTSRLARLLITETLLLAIIGSIGALGLAYWLRSAARVFLADRIPYVGTVPIDLSVFAFNLAIAAVTGVLCGLASVRGGMRFARVTAFGSGNALTISGSTKLRRLLLCAELAITFVLVVGAALLTQTLSNLNRRDRGFGADRVLTVRVAPQLPSTVDRAKSGAWQSFFAEYFSTLTQRIERLSGVASAAAVSNVPLAGVPMGLSRLSVDGEIVGPIANGALATWVASVSPRYFLTMGTPVVSGRDFTRDDGMGAPLVAIVNDAFRRRFAPGRDLVGSRVSYDNVVLTVVGVVADVPDRSLRDDAKPLLFTPLAQMPAGVFGWGQLTVVVRTHSLDPRAIAPIVRREIWSANPTAIIDELSSMNERVAVSVRSERQSAWLFGLFALAALAIATIGVYGVASYATAQRTKEIGIRLALGAGRADLSSLVISQALGSTVAGIAVGAIGAGLATRLIAAWLYGVTPLDVRTFVGAALILVSISLAASYIPARRAMRVDPLVTLRTD